MQELNVYPPYLNGNTQRFAFPFLSIAQHLDLSSVRRNYLSILGKYVFKHLISLLQIKVSILIFINLLILQFEVNAQVEVVGQSQY